jgi:hypothetical protein
MTVIISALLFLLLWLSISLLTLTSLAWFRSLHMCGSLTVLPQERMQWLKRDRDVDIGYYVNPARWRKQEVTRRHPEYLTEHVYMTLAQLRLNNTRR